MNNVSSKRAPIRAIGFPGRYVQGPGALATLGSLVTEFGGSVAAVIAGASAFAAAGRQVCDSLEAAGCRAQLLRFSGGCTQSAVDRLAGQAAEIAADTVIALGGGSVIDTAKGVSIANAGLLFVIPTVASTDAPTSRSIVLYDAEHLVVGVERMRRNPAAVLVDTDIVAAAPVRYFVAGMGDALSKKFEAEQCLRGGGLNFFGTPPPPVAMLLAERCYATIVEYGEAARARIETTGTPDDTVERVVEATVLLSGLGFESCGLATAHALSRGLCAHPGVGGALHGEVVAFGTIAQLLVEDRPHDEVHAHAALTHRLGLPVTLAQLGASPVDDAQLLDIARIACAAPYLVSLTPRPDEFQVAGALRAADELGRSVLARARS